MSQTAVNAMSRAAFTLSRPGLSELILSERLGPRGIFYVLAMSLHKEAARHASIIVLCGAFSVWDDEPQWADAALELVRRLIGAGELYAEMMGLEDRPT
jgi:hypothetical protein